MRTLIFACLAGVLAGCVPMLSGPVAIPKVEVKRLVDTPLPVTTAPEAIRVLDGRDALPRGFFYYTDHRGGPKRYKLFAIPGYPSAARAHLVIAGMATAEAGRVYGRQAEALLGEYKRQASALGANAVFVTGDGSGIVFAIVVGEGTPAPDATVEALLEAHRADVKGYKALGRPLELDLAAAEWDLTTQEAHCYAAIIALEPGANLSDPAQSALYLELESTDGLLGNRSYGGPKEPIANPDGLPIEAPQHGKFVALRSHAAELGCARGTAPARLRLWTRGKVTNVGSGGFRVAMFERVITKKELAAKIKASDAAWEQARLDAERQRAEDERRAAERERERERERADRDAAQARNGSGGTTRGGGSTYFSMSLKNECPRTVKLFIGTKPKFGSGTNTSVSANSVNSYSGNAPQMYWIIDDRENGLSSYTASPGQQRVRILPSCTGFAPQ